MRPIQTASVASATHANSQTSSKPRRRNILRAIIVNPFLDPRETFLDSHLREIFERSTTRSFSLKTFTFGALTFLFSDCLNSGVPCRLGINIEWLYLATAEQFGHPGSSIRLYSNLTPAFPPATSSSPTSTTRR